MVIGIIGESCTGKSTLAEKLQKEFGGAIFTGKDYLRLARNETIAQQLFCKKLKNALNGENIIYVITEQEHIAPLPEKTIRVFVTADLEQIKERFAIRMHGNLSAPVAAMLERQHGCFNEINHDFHVISGKTDFDTVVEAIRKNVF